jgi:thymidylate kinase
MLHPAFDSLIRALQRSGVAWCLLDDPGAAASAVDLLIDGAAAPQVRAMLAGQRFMALPPGAAQPAAQSAFVTYHRPTDQWVELRIYTELSYGQFSALRTRAEAACLARRQCEAGLCMLHADDRFWAFLLESLLDRRTLGAHDVGRLQALLPAARLDGPLARTLDTVCPPGWTAERILDGARQGEWQTLEGFGPALAAAWLRHPRLGAPLRRLTRRLSVALGERRSGLAVALLGPDGCGKSTLSARVAQGYYFPTRSVYMGLWQRTGKNDTALPGWSLAGRLFKAWRQYVTGQYHRWRGRLVIFDRYTYDALLPSAGKRTALARLYAWTLGHACPSPDLILLLDAPGEVMYARKHESSPEQLEAQRQGFLALQSRVPRLQVIDATCPQDAVRAEVVDRIWSRALARR